MYIPLHNLLLRDVSIMMLIKRSYQLFTKVPALEDVLLQTSIKIRIASKIKVTYFLIEKDSAVL